MRNWVLIQPASAYGGKLQNKRKIQITPTEYINMDFILGSVAEFERLWSHAGHIMDDIPLKMSPILFEALLFSYYNERFWDASLVIEAIYGARSEGAKCRLDEHTDFTGEEE